MVGVEARNRWGLGGPWFLLVLLSALARPIAASPVEARALPGASASRCQALAGQDMAAIGGTGSLVTQAMEGIGRAGGPVCRVTGRLAPAVAFQVELPVTGWTGRYLQTGCGGLCGNVRIDPGAADGCSVLQANGFALASTDMGHEGMDPAWQHDPVRRDDFAYRAVHLTALAAKALIRTYYGREANRSYFDGCSDGGREALVEAERFPEDFDGIIAGAPAMAFTNQNSLYHGWQAVANKDPSGNAILLAGRLPILHAAVLARCDALDGLKDGLVSMPGRCQFDPAAAACADGRAGEDCLSTAEVAAARRLYDGPRDPASGRRLTPGGPQPGSELQWAGVYVPDARDGRVFSAMIVSGALGGLIAPEGKPASAADLMFDQVTFERLSARHTLLDATDPDLSRFRARGGKLILFHGWADPHISPLVTIAFHQAVERQLGARATAGFERLYLLPGMGHCSGGEGPSAFDLLTPLLAWVERGVAPDAILTRAGEPSRFGLAGPAKDGAARPTSDGPPPGLERPQSAPAVKRSRPVYPYPYVAAFGGRGDTDDAANWKRGPAVPVSVPDWVGVSYFQPYKGITG